MYHANTSFTGNINIQMKAQNLHILYMTYCTFRADLWGHVSMWYEINYKISPTEFMWSDILWYSVDDL